MVAYPPINFDTKPDKYTIAHYGYETCGPYFGETIIAKAKLKQFDEHHKSTNGQYREDCDIYQ